MEPAKYFNNVIIGEFVLTKVPVKVFINDEYLTITSVDDIEDPMVGFGMDVNGAMQPFDYRYIDHLLVGGNSINLDTYNKAMNPESEDSSEEEETPEKETKKEESTMKLKPMIEKAVSKAQQKLFGTALSVKRGDTEKSEVSKDVQTLAKSLTDKELAKFAGTKHKGLPEKKKEVTEDLAADKKKAADEKEKLAKLNLKIAKEEEKLAKQNEGIGDINTLSEPYVYQVGDIVNNVDPNCDNFGSSGIVQKVIELPNEMGTLIKYTVTNNGDTYSPGQSLTKDINSMELAKFDDDMYDDGEYDDWDVADASDYDGKDWDDSDDDSWDD